MVFVDSDWPGALPQPALSIALHDDCVIGLATINRYLLAPAKADQRLEDAAFASFQVPVF